jgi:hypothetical protein
LEKYSHRDLPAFTSPGQAFVPSCQKYLYQLRPSTFSLIHGHPKPQHNRLPPENLHSTAQLILVEMSSTNQTTTKKMASNFLVLAPQTSSSYPKEQTAASRASSVSDRNAAQSASSVIAAAQQARSTRSDSISSSSSAASATRRFLKLGPVHYGGDPAESDFVEVDEK